MRNRDQVPDESIWYPGASQARPVRISERDHAVSTSSGTEPRNGLEFPARPCVPPPHASRYRPLAGPWDLATASPFVGFDAPYARDKDLRHQPLYVRRNAIEDVLDGEDVVFPVRRFNDDGVNADPQFSYISGRTLLAESQTAALPRSRARHRGPCRRASEADSTGRRMNRPR